MQSSILVCVLVGYISAKTAENGPYTTYTDLGGFFSGYRWMVENQPTNNYPQCNNQAAMPIIKSRYCGPGNARAQKENVKLTADGIELTIKRTTSWETTTNAQVYICSDGSDCSASNWKDAISKQKSVGYGDFVWHVDSKTGGKFPAGVVLGLYTYKPNNGDRFWGNVDTSKELDVEYADWSQSGRSTIGYTSWPEVIATPPHNMAHTETNIPENNFFPRCNAIKWREGKVLYGSWAPTSAGCFVKDFNDWTVHTSTNYGTVPTSEMIASINLWAYYLPRSTETATILVKDFKYTKYNSSEF